MGGWLREYSLVCQPVDYTDSPSANRVSEKANFENKIDLRREERIYHNKIYMCIYIRLF